MADLNGFDASRVEPRSIPTPVPDGKYTAVIIGSEWKTTKAGDGRYLELKLQIRDGPHNGRLIWARLNLENPNPIAVQIAKAELSSICRAVGVMRPRNSVDLHNKPLTISVRCKKREDTGEVVNEIRGYEDEKGQGPGPSTSTNGSTPPWKRPPQGGAGAEATAVPPSE